MPYTFDPASFDSVSLLAAPYRRAFFQARNSPAASRGITPVEAEVVSRAPADVRGQPQAETWELHIVLDGTTEAKKTSFYTLFDPGKGLVYFACTDGTPTNVRTRVRVLRIEQVAGFLSYFVVTLRAPNAVWEENAQASTVVFTGAGNAGTQTVPNAGNLRSRPSYEIVATSKKTDDPAYSFGTLLYGVFANRAPFAWNNLPICLSDRQETDTVIATSTEIQDTSKSHDLTIDVGASDTTIAVTNPIGGGLPNAPNFAYIVAGGGDALEQIYYTGITANVLQGCVRGIGGTTNGHHFNATKIYPSRMLKGGDDLRVFVNGREVRRYIGDLNTATSRIWTPISMPPRVKLTLKYALGTSETEIEFVEGVAALPEQGLLIINPGAGGNAELIYYAARDVANGKITRCERGFWFTGAATHAVTHEVLGNAQMFVIAWGRRADDGLVGSWPAGSTSIGEAPDDAAHRPLIQIDGVANASTQLTWKWGRGASDASSLFFDRTRPEAGAQWGPDYFLPDSDQNEASPLRSVATILAQWEDSDPDGGYLTTPRFSIFLPQGVKAAAAAITYDAQSRHEMRARVLGRDRFGMEVEIADHWDIAEALLTGQTQQPTDILHSISLNGVRAPITGSTYENGETDISSAAARYQMFILDQESEIDSVNIRVRKDAVGTNPGLRVWIVAGEQTAPSGGIIRQFTDLTLTSSTMGWKSFTSAAGPLRLQAGVYWIAMQQVSGTAQIYLAHGSPPHTKNNRSYASAVLIDNKAFCFTVTHKHGGPVQPEVRLLNSGSNAYFDNVELKLNDASADKFTPYVDRESAEGNSYHCIGRVTTVTPVQSFDLNAFMRLSATLTVDCDTLKATYKETGDTESLPLSGAVIPDDVPNEGEWFVVMPGGQSVTYTEYKMAATVVTAKSRGSKS